MNTDTNNPFAKLQSNTVSSRTIPQPPPVPQQPVIWEAEEAEEEEVSIPEKNGASNLKMIEKAEELYDYFRYLSLGNASLYDRYKVLKELCETTQKIGHLDELWEYRSQTWSNSLTEYEDALIQKIRMIPSVPFWNHTIGQYHSKIVRILKEIEHKNRYSDWKALYRHFRRRITCWWVSIISILCVIFATYEYVTINQNSKTFNQILTACETEFKAETSNFSLERVDEFLTNCQKIEVKAKQAMEIPQLADEKKSQIDKILVDLHTFIAFAEKCKIYAQKEREAIEEEKVNTEKLLPESDFQEMYTEGEKLGLKKIVQSFSNHRDEIQQLTELESEYYSWKAKDDTTQKTVERLQNAKTWVKLLSEFQADFCKEQFEKDSERFQKSIAKILKLELKRFEKKIPIKSNESKYDYEDRAKVNNKQIQEICDIEETAGFSLFEEEFKNLNESLEKAQKKLTDIQNK